MKTVVVASRSDPRFSAISDDCMGTIGQGTYYHHRLGTLFIINSDLPPTASRLPITPIGE